MTANRREERETLLGVGMWESATNVRGRRGGKDWSIENTRVASGKGASVEKEPLEDDDPFKTEVMDVDTFC